MLTRNRILYNININTRAVIKITLKLNNNKLPKEMCFIF